MQNKSDMKQYGKQKKYSFLSPLVLKNNSSDWPRDVDLRGKVLLEKQLVKIVDIKPRVFPSASSGQDPSASSGQDFLQEQKAQKVWVGRQKTYPRLLRFFKAPQILLRTVAALLIIGLNWTAFAAVGTTVAIFHDEESAGGTLSAGSVEFSLAVTPFDTVAASLNLETSTSTSKSVEVLPAGESNPFQYYASSTAFAGDEYFCDDLLVSALVDGTEIFNGSLKDLTTAATPIPQDGTGEDWEFIFTTAMDHPNSVCHFDIDFNGWQTRNDLSCYKEGGYTDTETVSSSIYSSGFRIQKVYFDQEAGATIVTGDATANASVVNVVNTNTTVVDCEGDDCDVVVVNDNDTTIINNVSAVANTGGNSADGGTIARRGWVEIYNQTNDTLNLSGWRICDDIACDVIPVNTTPVGPHGFAVITEDETLWHEWNIPDDVVLIVLSDGTIGGGLDYSADMLLIKRPDEMIIDQMNWGLSDYSWANYNSDIWNPGISVSTSTEVLAREPLGYDTNQPDDFVELGLPVVDLLYPDEDDDSNVWYWGQNYLIEWTAFNQNGEDDELLIDIFAIFDENGNGNLDDEDSVLQPPIALDIVNGINGEGAHEWTVPTGFIGTIWIQVVAVGPENPMLFSGTISGDIWDPIPEEMAESYKDEYFAQQLGFKGFRTGQSPAQAPVQVSQGQTLGTEESVEPFVGEEDPEEAVEPAVAESFGEAKEEVLSDEVPLVGEGEDPDLPVVDGQDMTTPELDGVLPEDEATNPPLADGQDTNPAERDGQDPEPEEEPATPAVAESFGVVKPSSPEKSQSSLGARAKGYGEAKEETQTNIEEN